MIIVLTSCGYFIKGFEMLVEMHLSEAPAFRNVLYVDDIKKVSKDKIEGAKAIVVDYGQSDTKSLNTLLEIKNRYAQSYLIFITRDSCFESTIENTIFKNRRWYQLEKQQSLTKMETMLLPYIVSGKKNKEISRFVNVTGKTVSHHRRNIYKKYAVTNLTGLYKKLDHNA